LPCLPTSPIYTSLSSQALRMITVGYDYITGVQRVSFISPSLAFLSEATNRCSTVQENRTGRHVSWICAFWAWSWRDSWLRSGSAVASRPLPPDQRLGVDFSSLVLAPGFIFSLPCASRLARSGFWFGLSPLLAVTTDGSNRCCVSDLIWKYQYGGVTTRIYG